VRPTGTRPLVGLVVAGAATLALTACSTTVEGAGSPAAGPAAPSTTAQSASPTLEAAGPSANARGNLVKALGEEGGLDSESGAPLLTFTVDAITVDVPCTDDWQAYGTQPEPGHHLVAVALHVSTTADVTTDDYLTLSGYDFKYIGADGLTVDSLDSMATYGCLDDGQAFTSDVLGPAQSYAGSLVLDLPATSGTLVLDPSWGQGGGWEYTF
jgi:hypothetical protein